MSVAIKVTNLSKSFKLHTDKPKTLKERLVLRKSIGLTKKEVLKNIDLEINHL